MSRFRPAMGWLHNWAGLVFGWILFVIFVTGSCGYYRHEITLMMTPELRPLVGVHVPQDVAARRASDWLAANAVGAQEWTINLPDEKSPALRVAWFGKTSGEMVLDPRIGRPLTPTPRETDGGDFLYRLHSDLHFVSPIVGRVIVSLLGVLLLVLLVTGIVTHRNILRNLFRLRWAKGWRTRLDLHNMTGILGLPFHLFIVLSGLVTVMMLVVPWGVMSVYGSAGLGAFADEAFPTVNDQSSATALPHSDVQWSLLIAEAKRHWHSDGVGEIHFDKPGAVGASVTISHPVRGMLSMRKPSVTFDPASGAVIGTANDNLSAVSQLHTGMFGLHVAHFAGPAMRLALFFLGLVGAAMVATGLLLWTDKRWHRDDPKQQRSVAIVDRLNAFVIAGLPIAIAGYLWANRIIAHDTVGRAASEQNWMFIVWGLVAVICSLTPQRLVWPLFLLVGGLALSSLGLVDALGSSPVWIIDGVLVVVGSLLIGWAVRVQHQAMHRVAVE